MTNEAIDSKSILQTINRQDFWQHHVDQWRESGLSKAMYSKQHDLVYHQMMYWSTKLEPIVDAKTGGGFVPVSLATDMRNIELSIRLPNGITIDGFNDHRLDAIAKLIAQL